MSPPAVVDVRLLQPVIKIYRMEGWFELLKEALLLALVCAKRQNDAANVLRYSLELISEGK
jgi:hypothetical protein